MNQRSNGSGRSDMREEFLRALRFRHACKLFDEKRALARVDLDYILEAGRLAPSSLGLEPWRFLVVEDQALRRRLRPSCWNQVQITSASAVIVITALKADLRLESDYPRRMLRRLVGADEMDEAMRIYRDIAHGDITAWSIAQCHIAAAHMMLAAAVIGVDSCPMGGFEPAAVAEVLQIDRGEVDVALLLALGYRAQPQPPKQRLALRDLVTYC
jgi:nitroreductase